MRAPETWEQERAKLSAQLAEAQKECERWKDRAEQRGKSLIDAQKECAALKGLRQGDAEAFTAWTAKYYALQAKLDCAMEAIKSALEKLPATFQVDVYFDLKEAFAKLNGDEWKYTSKTEGGASGCLRPGSTHPGTEGAK